MAVILSRSQYVNVYVETYLIPVDWRQINDEYGYE